MTQAALPAHLQGRQVRSLLDRASEGMGSSLPPRISTKGNAFTFIDGAGNAYQPIAQFQGVIVDVADVMAKRYYADKWDPTKDEPPQCWSMNGIGPSRDAPAPQSATCELCPHNERGSKISEVSGAAIKACRDEKPIAILIPQMNMIFQLVITPGSFKTWKAYAATLQNYGVEPALVWTHFSYTPGKTGEILFGQGDYIDTPTADLVDAVNRERKTDAIVGRTDQPRHVAIAAHVQPAQLVASAVAQEPAPFVPAASPFVSAAPIAAPQPTSMALPSTNPLAAPTAPSPSNPAPRPRGRRAAAAPAVAPAAAQAPMTAPVAPASPQAADTGIPPFLPRQAPAAPVQPAAAPAPGPGGNNFGIQAGAPVNPELSNMLKGLFDKQPQG